MQQRAADTTVFRRAADEKGGLVTPTAPCVSQGSIFAVWSDGVNRFCSGGKGGDSCCLSAWDLGFLVPLGHLHYLYLAIAGEWRWGVRNCPEGPGSAGPFCLVAQSQALRMKAGMG